MAVAPSLCEGSEFLFTPLHMLRGGDNNVRYIDRSVDDHILVDRFRQLVV